MGREVVFTIRTAPEFLGFRRPQTLGEVREGERTTVVDPKGNSFGDVSVRDGRLVVHRAENIVNCRGQSTPTNDGMVVDGGVVLQNRYLLPTSTSTMISIRRSSKRVSRAA